MQEPLHHEHHAFPDQESNPLPQKGNRASLGPRRDFRFTIRERKERESNPQGTQHVRPASNRFPSPFGWPFDCLFNASARTRTQNIPLEAGHDFPFTTEALQKRKARDSNPHLPRGRAALAVRSGQPYPATFRKG